jgi:DNA-binding transcriptional MerR regulator
MTDSEASDTFSISELGKEFGITARAMRFYEDKGLLNPRRCGQRRIYSRADRTRLILVMRGRRLGWQLDEIRAVIDMYDTSEGELKQLEYTCEKIAERRARLLQQQRDIESSLRDMLEIEQRCRDRIEQMNIKAVKTPSISKPEPVPDE